MATIILLSNRTLPAGTQTYGPASIPVGLTSATLVIDRTNLTSPTLAINWSFELSQDNGQTWLPWGAAGTIGGVLKDDQNKTITISSFTIALPGPAQAGWQGRGSVTCNESCITSVTATIV